MIMNKETPIEIMADGTMRPLTKKEVSDWQRRMNPHAKALGKLGGKVKSEAKAAAARENGKKGGRPRKQKLRAIDVP